MTKVLNLSQSPGKALLALQVLVIYNYYHRSQRGYPQEYHVFYDIWSMHVMLHLSDCNQLLHVMPHDTLHVSSVSKKCI